MRESLYKFFTMGKVRGPVELILFVTYKCNCRCKQCFFWKDINSQKNELSLEEYKLISKSAGRLDQLAISGGEPYLRDDLVRICEVFWENNRVKKISIPTNGTQPEYIYEQTKKILDAVGSQLVLNVSIDGFQKTHDEMRARDGVFEAAVKTCSLLKKLKTAYQFTFRVLTIVSNQNIFELEAFTKFVKKEIDPDLHSFEIVRATPMDKKINPPEHDTLKHFFKFYAKFVQDNYLNSEIYNKRFGILKNAAFKFKERQLDYYVDLLYGRAKGVTCFADNLVSVIYPNGDYAFCELKNPIANVKDFDYDLVKIMNSKAIKEKRSQIRKCSCIHSCFQNYNTILSPKFMLKALFF